MSFTANTIEGVLRRAWDDRTGEQIYLLKCPGCGEWLRLSDDQYHGRVSVDHAAMGCPGKYHKRANFSIAVWLVGWSSE